MKPTPSIDPEPEAQIRNVCDVLAAVVEYRPEAPSDGLGNITVPDDELDYEAEREAFIRHWWKSEDGGTYVLGCPDYRLRRTMMYAVFAASMCCSPDPDRAALLLELALNDLRLAVQEDEQHGGFAIPQKPKSALIRKLRAKKGKGTRP